MTDHDMNIDMGAGRQARARVNYPANSQKVRKPEPEKKRTEKVVTEPVIQRKKNLRDRFRTTFLSEDSHSVWTYVVMDVLVPAAKNMVSDAVSQGIERLMFGDTRPRPAAGARSSYTSYNRMSQPFERAREPLSRRARATHDFNDIILSSRGEAEDVLDGLRNLISQYDVATVSDLYDLVGLTGEFTDDKWGWLDLRTASIRAIRGGYILNLPRTNPIA